MFVDLKNVSFTGSARSFGFFHASLLLIAALFSASVLAQSNTLSPRVAKQLLSAYEEIEAENFDEALEQLNDIIDSRGENMRPFDRASVLQVRGSAHVNMENFEAGIADFAEVIRLSALPEEQNLRMRFNLAQLYFVTERYEEAIRFFEEWLAVEEDPDASAYFMLAASHYNLKDFENTLVNINRAIELAEEPDKRSYDLKNITLSELGYVEERTEHLEAMVEIWPEELPYYRQLSAIYLEQDMRLESFAVLETAYLEGLPIKEDDKVILAQFYSGFNNPHRGAELLEREMAEGNVEKNVDNLELLSQLWSQAREHQKAIPVLREAAQLADTGKLSFRLGQSLLADEQNEAAETALENAIEKGDMDDGMMGEAWMLLGNARFNQAGPGDLDQRAVAAEAFEQAEQFENTEAQASSWRGYIEAINQTERRQVALEREQAERLEEAAQERLLTSCRARQLAGSSLSQECQEILAEAEARAEADRSNGQ
jgi:tetratricopeptide (TPR) repeat protein